MGLNMTQVFPTKYLSAQDVTEQGVQMRIQSVQLESVDQDLSKPQKPVVYFQGAEKGFVLNVTNNNTIISMYGPDSDGWLGKDIVLFKTHVDFQGRMVEAIRVRPGIPQTGQAPAQAGQTPVQTGQVPTNTPQQGPRQVGEALPNYERGDPLNYEA